MPDQITPDAGAILAGNPAQPNPAAPGQPAPLPLQPRQTPELAAGPTPAPAQPNAAPAQPPQVNPAVAQVVHHATFGQAIKNLVGSLEGVQYNYAVDPATGQMQETAVKAKPGQFFRNILVGALVGGAAAEHAHTENPNMGLAGGLLTGGAANVQEAQQENLLRQKQAGADFERNREVQSDKTAADKAANEALHWQATLAHWTTQELHSASQLNLDNQREIEHQNDQGQLLLDKVISQHGTLAELPENGKTGNGPALMDYFTKNPSALKSPDGGMRIPVKRVDLSGLVYDPAHYGWKDAKSGQHVDLDARTTWQVYDLPKDSPNAEEKIPIKGSELVKLFPAGVGSKIDPNGTYRLTASELVAVGTHQRQQANTARTEDIARQRELLNTSAKLISEKLSNARTRLQSLPDKESDEANTLRSEIKDLDGQLDDLLAGINPYFKAHNLAYQQRHFPWQTLKSTEAAMVSPQGEMRAVSTNDVQKAQQAGWSLIPRPAGR